MSFIKIDGINLYYEKKGRRGDKIILLHGWGQNTEMMDFISEHLKKSFVVYNIDFPGFGKSDEPLIPFDTNDYAAFLNKFCHKKNIDNPIFIAHSFGCRVALRYAYKYGAKKMALTGAAGIRDKRGIVWHLKTYSYKLLKKIFNLKIFNQYKDYFTNKMGSEDYRNSSGIMRETFLKVVNEDLKDILKYIESETLLVFGENDEATPLYKGRLMEKLMPNATLIIFENDDHYAYINEALRFNLVLDAFLGVSNG